MVRPEMTSRSLRGRRQAICDNSIKASVIKNVTLGGEGGSKNVQNCVTSYIDNPLTIQQEYICGDFQI
jgi:hypothetical protein